MANDATDDIITIVTDLADGELTGPAWEEWLAAHPEAAAEVAIARRVRAVMAELRATAIVMPPGFEARLMARLREDMTLLTLLDLSLDGIGRTLLELLSLMFGLLPAPQPAATR